MIKVIKHGNKGRVTCPECDCVFTYEESDTETIDEWLAYTRIVHCPDCGEKIVLSTEDTKNNYMLL